ncbi:hypothetical protein [Rheinheimera salexigens]|uniref:Uncharacterized protein n=1 Tax=Rheinheimera salexigens TaxID=1628148 RepID=A0A1E7Q2J4_9GAMM|nr:hypothetical protein [Rheinheimera salexigens]OEY68356.1 hypothetical protein BI198_01315 [Rheinheimera salexigens]
MKKFFWIIVIFLLVLTFSDHDVIRPHKEKLYGLFMDEMADAGDNKQAALRQVKKELMAAAEQWGEGQRKQLEKATASIEALLKFQQDYCISGDFNPILFGEPLKQSCNIISNHQHTLTKP